MKKTLDEKRMDFVLNTLELQEKRRKEKIQELYNNFLENSKDLDPTYRKIIDKHFWDLL